jgi:hypothetical protein
MGELVFYWVELIFSSIRSVIAICFAKYKYSQRGIEICVGMGCKKSENTSLNPDQCVRNIYSPNTKCPKFASKKIIKPFRLSMVG